MKKFQSLSDFQALPENQMQKTVGGWDFFMLLELAKSITGPGHYAGGDSHMWPFSYESDIQNSAGIQHFGVTFCDFYHE